MKTIHATEKVRKALEIARLFNLPAAHDRRKFEDVGIGWPVPRNLRGQAVDHQLEQAGPRIDAADAHGTKQRVRDRLNWIVRNIVHMTDHPLTRPYMGWLEVAKIAYRIESYTLSRNSAGTSASIAALAVLARMRSLLIMIEVDRISRR